MSDSQTQQRVAVVTGASSGIGEATARALAAAGYRVALLARRVDRINAVADDFGGACIAVEADVTDRDSLVAAAARVQGEPGVVATELPDHITHDETRQGVQQLYSQAQVTAQDVAEVITFILGRPRHLATKCCCAQPDSSDRPEQGDPS